MKIVLLRLMDAVFISNSGLNNIDTTKSLIDNIELTIVDECFEKAYPIQNKGF